MRTEQSPVPGHVANSNEPARQPLTSEHCLDIDEFARANNVAMVPDCIARVRREINAIAPDAPRYSRAGCYSRSALDALDHLERLVSGLLEGEKPPILVARHPPEGTSLQ